MTITVSKITPKIAITKLNMKYKTSNTNSINIGEIEIITRDKIIVENILKAYDCEIILYVLVMVFIVATLITVKLLNIT